MIDLKSYLARFSATGQPIIEKALKAAEPDGRHLTEGHLVLILLDEKRDFFQVISERFETPLERIRELAFQQIQENSKHTGSGFKIHSSAVSLFKRASDNALREHRSEIDASDLIVSCSFLNSEIPKLKPSLQRFFNLFRMNI